MPTMARPEYEVRCPECDQPAVEVTRRRAEDYILELAGTCKLGHIWTTRWFTAEAL